VTVIPSAASTRNANASSREHHVARYNPAWNTLLQAWVDVLTGGASTADLHSFGLAGEAGTDAHFSLGSQTAYCWSQTGDRPGSQT